MRFHLLVTTKRLLVAGALLVAAPFAVSLSGLVSVAANTGHFAPVEWFLHWTLGNAVERQSFGIAKPEEVDLADPALVRRGAGHFATGCAQCHASPGDTQAPVMLSMMPPPPRLETQVGEWKDRELFWIGLHGIKYSGMPSWTTQEREDEVWAMVAFLRALPGMSPQTYADLALGGDASGRSMPPVAGIPANAPDGAAGERLFEAALADCSRCHGEDGRGRGTGAFPSIAGQSAAYLYANLQAYASDLRHSGFMEPAAARYGDETLQALARWYARQPVDAVAPDAAAPVPARTAADGVPAQIMPADSRSLQALPAGIAPSGTPATTEDLRELGRRIAAEGLPSRKIPACESCHGADGRARNPNVPYISGQPHWFLKTQLTLFHEEHRGGTRFAHLMTEFMKNMTEEQIEAVSAHYAAEPLGR